MADLYKGIAGSPITYLAADISANQTTISIDDDSALPDAPNICTIGYGEHLETVKYGQKSNGVLQEVVRGVEGIPRAWQAGTEVARFFTTYDHNAIIEAHNTHLAEIVSYNTSITRDLSLPDSEQIVTLINGRTAKYLIIYAVVVGDSKACWGFVATENSCIAQISDGSMSLSGNRAILLRNDTSNYVTGNAIIESGQIKIAWAKTGEITGTAHVRVLAVYHD